MEGHKSKRSKVVLGIIMFLCCLAAIYLGISAYFIKHFYLGSTINSMNVSGKTVEEVNEEMSSEIQNYSLELQEKGDVKEQIKGSDIDVKYSQDGESKIKSLKDNQNPLGWISGVFGKKNNETAELISYDEQLLNKVLSGLPGINSKNVVESKDASFEYGDGGYKIVNEVYGNKIDKEVLNEKVSDAILKGDTTLDLDSSDCYKKPKYTADSQEVTDAKNTLDKYTNVTITYASGNNKEVVDGSAIHNWLSVDDNMQVTFDEKKVKKYVATKLGSTFNTFGKTRDFTTTSGNKVKVSGGDYGWLIDSTKETKDLIETIKSGQSTTKEPIYSQKAISSDNNDIGNTYVEVNFTKQHVWFYKNGSLVTDGPCVSGNVSLKLATPPGTYALNYKEKNATLKGEDYSSPVTYWMPFNGNVGLHDASWRSPNEFGGSTYLTSGSHGCVNLPVELAHKIFDNIEAGTPVVCYNE